MKTGIKLLKYCATLSLYSRLTALWRYMNFVLLLVVVV